jgi:hypothetical protein
VAKLLVVNGCSLTYGTELAEPGREAWPALLGDQLGIPVVNLGCSGGSNRRLMRTTVTNLDRVCRDAGVETHDALVLSMWTGIDRTEYFRAKKLDTGPRPGLPYEDNWYRVGIWRVDEDSPTRAYFRYLADDVTTTVNWLVDWLMLDGFLRSRGVTPRYAFGWHVFRNFASMPGGEIGSLVDMLDPTTIFGSQAFGPDHVFTSSRDYAFTTISSAQNFEHGEYGHPLAEAHAHYAKLLAAWLGAQDPASGIVS